MKKTDLVVFGNMFCWKKTFYSMSDKGATIEEILEYNLMNKSKLKGTLIRFTSNTDDKY